MFGKRPIIKEGESLTSYLMRIGEANGIDADKIINYLCPKSKNYKIMKRDINVLDILPHRMINSTKLFESFGISKDIIEKSTFTNIFPKFLENIFEGEYTYRSVINEDLHKYERYFCPQCLKEEGVYKLLWCVKEIVICDKHKVKLDCKCNVCGTIQPYFSHSLAQFKCYNCGFLLYQQNAKIEYNEEIIEQQLNIYKQWRYLLDGEKILMKRIMGFSLEKSLIVYVLYLHDILKKSGKYESEKLRNQKYLRAIKNTLKGGVRTVYVSIKSLFKFIREMGLDLEQLSTIEIPPKYIKSLTSNDNCIIEFGVCQAPWCTSHDSNANIVNLDKCHYNKDKYRNHSVCIKCLCIYGFNRDSDKWEEIGDKIQLYWLNVLPYLYKGERKKNICRELKIDYYTLDKAIGYLLNQEIDSIKTIKDKYLNIEIQEGLIEKFKHLTELEGSMMENSQRLFGWSRSQFHYFYFQNNVQNFLLFNNSNPRKKIKKRGIKRAIEDEVNAIIAYNLENDVDITAEDISRELNICSDTLRNRKLLEVIRVAKEKQKRIRIIKLEEIVKERVINFLDIETNDEILTCSNIYKSLNISEGKIRKSNKNLMKWIREKVEQHNNLAKQNIKESYKLMINKVVKEIYDSGMEITIKKVVEILEINEYIFKNYDLKKVYFDAKVALVTGR